MKQLLRSIAVILVAAGAWGCQHMGGTVDFIPGVYARDIHQEYAVARDTLFITAIVSGHSYTMVEHTVYRRMLNGRLQRPTRDTARWTGLYDVEAGVLHEQRLGRIYSFDPKGNRLFVGSSAYIKIR